MDWRQLALVTWTTDWRQLPLWHELRTEDRFRCDMHYGLKTDTFRSWHELRIEDRHLPLATCTTDRRQLPLVIWTTDRRQIPLVTLDMNYGPNTASARDMNYGQNMNLRMYCKRIFFSFALNVFFLSFFLFPIVFARTHTHTHTLHDQSSTPSFYKPVCGFGQREKKQVNIWARRLRDRIWILCLAAAVK